MENFDPFWIVLFIVLTMSVGTREVLSEAAVYWVKDDTYLESKSNPVFAVVEHILGSHSTVARYSASWPHTPNNPPASTS